MTDLTDQCFLDDEKLRQFALRAFVFVKAAAGKPDGRPSLKGCFGNSSPVMVIKFLKWDDLP